jgi:hypothetical protein
MNPGSPCARESEPCVISQGDRRRAVEWIDLEPVLKNLLKRRNADER